MKDVKRILEEIKPKIKALVFDFDGTLKSSSEPECNPMELVDKIVAGNKSVGIVTASGVSALMGLGKQLKKAYLGIANGMALYKIDDKGIAEIYKYPVGNVDEIISAWQKVMKEISVDESGLVEKGLKIFREFLVKDWGEYIAKELIEKAAPYEGKCFMEELKVTVVMPRDEIFFQEEFIKLMRNALGDKYVVEMGDTTFAHITRYMGMAPKLFALRRIQQELGLDDNEIVTFGDMPNGNDRGLLIDSKLPYTFTNKLVDGVPTPPFVLPGSEIKPIASVYKAVKNLLG